MKTKPSLKTDNPFMAGLNVIKGLGLAVGNMIIGKSLVPGIETVMSQFHNTVYKGFPVKINVPINGVNVNIKF